MNRATCTHCGTDYFSSSADALESCQECGGPLQLRDTLEDKR